MLASIASARCLCGSVSLGFARRVPLMRLECACCDCRQANEFESTRGGPRSSSALSQLFYFANDVVPPASLKGLELTQLRDTARSTRLVTRCCRSTLAVDHAAYNERLVMVPADSCVLDADAADIAPLARIYAQDWEEEHDGPLDAIPSGGWPTVGNAGTPEEEAHKEAYRRVFREAQVPLPRVGISVQELFRRVGLPTVLGLVERQRF
eukprot:TRINITY_DN49829_c0_g1_i1.p1 TRINITY_DN49829_c0_g1~~TRINITY_DN49829_c0_g1_i1.p1  ORF type:complete len:228 (-),score=28.32 TRINITY_DN49829_c0_g1_i1:106-732(-)